jgi:hypothetical protein
LFDYDITPISAEDLTLIANDMPVLDAINNVAEQVDAKWSVTPGVGTGKRENLFKNPRLLTTINYCSGEIPSNSSLYATYGGVWNPANVVWDAGSSGALIHVQALGGENRAFFRFGRENDAASHTLSFTKAAKTGVSFIGIQLGNNAPANSAINYELWALVYDDNGDFYAEINLGTAGYLGVGGIFELDRGHANLPYGTFYLEFLMHVNHFHTTSYDHFTISLFQSHVLVEVVSATSYLTFLSAWVVDSFNGAYPTGAYWTGTADDSTSIYGVNTLNWSDTADDAPYDLDIGSTDYVGDIELSYNAMDSINSVIVVGGMTYEDIDWEYPGDNQLVHFDLETRVFPPEGGSVPTIYKNDGTDGVPIWTGVTVQARAGNVLGVGNDVLWDEENHWVEWNDSPPDLKRAWRVVGRIEVRLRAIVKDDQNIADTFERVGVVCDERAISTDYVHALAEAELRKRLAPATVTFTSYTPGLKVGQKIDVVDSARGLNLIDMIIHKVRHTYLGGGYAKFFVECGDKLVSLVDIAVGTQNDATERPYMQDNTLIVTLSTLIDEDGTDLCDEDGILFYE